MNATSTESKDTEPGLDIGAIARLFWRGKWWIGVFTALGSCTGVAVALLLPEVFRAETLLQVRQMSGSSGNLGGLASLAAEFSGIIGGGLLSLNGDNERDVAIATLRSRTVVEAFIEDNELLPKLYESEWDSEAQAWKDSDLEDQPTVWEAYNDFIEDVLRVTEDRRTGLVTVAVDWTDPEEARRWVTELVARTNAHLRERAIYEGQRNLEYLRTQARQIGQVELVQALYGLVEEQLKQMMVANVGDEFALKTIDPAVVPKKRIRPKRTLIALLGFFVGGALGLAVTVVRAS